VGSRWFHLVDIAAACLGHVTHWRGGSAERRGERKERERERGGGGAWTAGGGGETWAACCEEREEEREEEEDLPHLEETAALPLEELWMLYTYYKHSTFST